MGVGVTAQQPRERASGGRAGPRKQQNGALESGHAPPALALVDGRLRAGQEQPTLRLRKQQAPLPPVRPAPAQRVNDDRVPALGAHGYGGGTSRRKRGRAQSGVEKAFAERRLRTSGAWCADRVTVRGAMSAPTAPQVSAAAADGGASAAPRRRSPCCRGSLCAHLRARTRSRTRHSPLTAPMRRQEAPADAWGSEDEGEAPSGLADGCAPWNDIQQNAE